MDPTQPQSSRIGIDRVSRITPGEEIAWTTEEMPAWLLSGERTQIVWKREDGVTMYETQDEFYGPLAYLLKMLHLGKLQVGFESLAKGLKEHAEKKATGTSKST